MVMHARKTQRIGDGYFEKHQTHPYQNSKYSSKSSYERDRMRERDSPNGNSYRSDSPDCDSPRERQSYHSKSLYVSKNRDKERENRDYKRDKYSDCVSRSPKDKRLRDSRESEHRTNHDRNSTDKNESHSLKSSQNSSRDSQRKLSSSCQGEKRGGGGEERERVVRCGDWSEHLSSSGKKYYYNCKTEISQWEKPREWLVEVRPPPPPLPPPQPPPAHHQLPSPQQQQTSSTAAGSHRHPPSSYPPSSNLHQTRGGAGLDKHSLNSSSSSRKAGGGGGGSGGGGRGEKLTAHLASSGGGGSSYWTSVQHHDSSKPSSDLPNSSGGGGEGQTTDMEICSGDSTPTSEASGELQQQRGGPAATEGGAANAPGPPPAGGGGGSGLGGAAGGSGALHVETLGHPAPDPGPPTPTHSETQDCTDARKPLCGSSLVGVVSSNSSSPPTTGSLLTSGTALAVGLRPQAPHLTPSLVNHYRDDLVNHVRGWPADLLEKQAAKLSEEAHSLGALCTRVSAELKCARSVVRLTEIQATLQEQRVLFLRQQIKNLEELKSQNSFMSDEP